MATNQPEKTLGKPAIELPEVKAFIRKIDADLREQKEPCPGCGCPYPGDHTQDCSMTERDSTILDGFQTIANTIKNLTDAVSGLHKIVQHQQGQIDRLLKHETGQPI